ncbi:sorting nexin 25 [Sorochytrium milnesiophthora]
MSATLSWLALLLCVAATSAVSALVAFRWGQTQAHLDTDLASLRAIKTTTSTASDAQEKDQAAAAAAETSSKHDLSPTAVASIQALRSFITRDFIVLWYARFTLPPHDSLPVLSVPSPFIKDVGVVLDQALTALVSSLLSLLRAHQPSSRTSHNEPLFVTRVAVVVTDKLQQHLYRFRTATAAPLQPADQVKRVQKLRGAVERLIAEFIPRPQQQHRHADPSAPSYIYYHATVALVADILTKAVALPLIQSLSQPATINKWLVGAFVASSAPAAAQAAVKEALIVTDPVPVQPTAEVPFAVAAEDDNLFLDTTTVSDTSLLPSDSESIDNSSVTVSLPSLDTILTPDQSHPLYQPLVRFMQTQQQPPYLSFLQHVQSYRHLASVLQPSSTDQPDNEQRLLLQQEAQQIYDMYFGAPVSKQQQQQQQQSPSARGLRRRRSIADGLAAPAVEGGAPLVDDALVNHALQIVQEAILVQPSGDVFTPLEAAVKQLLETTWMPMFWQSELGQNAMLQYAATFAQEPPTAPEFVQPVYDPRLLDALDLPTAAGKADRNDAQPSAWTTDDVNILQRQHAALLAHPFPPTQAQRLSVVSFLVTLQCQSQALECIIARIDGTDAAALTRLLTQKAAVDAQLDQVSSMLQSPSTHASSSPSKSDEAPVVAALRRGHVRVEVTADTTTTTTAATATTAAGSDPAGSPRSARAFFISGLGTALSSSTSLRFLLQVLLRSSTPDSDASSATAGAIVAAAVLRTYADFARLHESLSQEHPQVMADEVMVLPRRHRARALGTRAGQVLVSSSSSSSSLSSSSTSSLRRRMAAAVSSPSAESSVPLEKSLEGWLNAVLSHQALQQSSHVAAFLGSDSDPSTADEVGRRVKGMVRSAGDILRAAKREAEGKLRSATPTDPDSSWSALFKDAKRSRSANSLSLSDAESQEAAVAPPLPPRTPTQPSTSEPAPQPPPLPPRRAPTAAPSLTASTTHDAVSMTDTNLLLESLFSLIQEAFTLHGPVRRRVFVLLKQVVRQSFASTIHQRLNGLVTSDAVSPPERAIEGALNRIVQSVWPSGGPHRTHVKQPRDNDHPDVYRQRALEWIHSEANLPEIVVRLLGRTNTESGLQRLFDLLQQEDANTTLIVDIVDKVADMLVQELRSY